MASCLAVYSPIPARLCASLFRHSRVTACRLFLLHATTPADPCLKNNRCASSRATRQKVAAAPARTTASAERTNSAPQAIDYPSLRATQELILDRMALVDPAIATVKELEAAILYADTLMQLDVSNVQPLYTVLEDEHVFCPMFEDKPEQDCTRKEIFANAAKVEEDYFVAPSPAFVALRKEERRDVAETLRESKTTLPTHRESADKNPGSHKNS